LREVLCEHYLAAIESALARDYPATLVLMSDDGWTYGSRAIIEQYGKRVPTTYREIRFMPDRAGKAAGADVRNTEPQAACAELLRGGRLYPSPPASGCAYRVSAFRAISPVAEEGINRYGADFCAIYGAALSGPRADISKSFSSAKKASGTRWKVRKKVGTRVRSGLSLVLYPPVSDFLVPHISHPLARRRVAGR
jgi:glycosyltransferase involved in cell wall biosynthesis